MTLAIMYEHLGIVDDQHLRELLLLAEDCEQGGRHANGTKANYDKSVALLLGIHFSGAFQHCCKHKSKLGGPNDSDWLTYLLLLSLGLSSAILFPLTLLSLI
jgi:hypothetical protein